MIFDIAGLSFSIEGGDQTMRTLRQLQGFAPFVMRMNNKPEEIFYYKAGATISPKPSNATLLHQFDFEEVDCYFYRDGNVLQFDMIPRDGSSPYSSRYIIGFNEVIATDCGSTLLLRFALWMAYGYFAVTHNRIAIHSSVIVYDKKAVLFLGESGTGKSTHTRLWRENIEGSYLLNDDSPIIAYENGEVRVYGSPWSGKTPCYRQENCLVSAVVRLSQAPYNKIHKLSKLSSLGAMLPSCPPAFAYDSGLQNAILDTLSGILRQTPVYHLECLPNSDAVYTVINEIWGNQ